MINIVDQLPRIESVPQRPLTGIDGIAVHHSADMGTPASWARYHTTPPDQGGPAWGPDNCICYHAAIMADGTAYKCAYDRDKTSGVANQNYHLLHVVCQGDFTKTPPTAAQIRSLLDVLRGYMAAYSIPVERVKGHREWQEDPAWATTCPGINLGEYVRFMLTIGL